MQRLYYDVRKWPADWPAELGPAASDPLILVGGSLLLCSNNAHYLFITKLTISMKYIIFHPVLVLSTFQCAIGLSQRLATTRRVVLSSISTTASIIPLFNPSKSNAAMPLTADEADNFNAKLARKLRKAPPKILRPTLNLDFAVLLMRSSYNAVDELDFVAMDQFQKDFFLIRQAEYLSYVNELGPGMVKQGDLTDPFYFDFISFAQYATINRDVSDPSVVFEEQQPVLIADEEGDRQEFVSKIIRRDPSIDNSMLPKMHDELVGTKILDKFNEQFGRTTSAIPILETGRRQSSTTLLAALQQLVNLFLISGFAFDGKVLLKKESSKGIEFEITLTAPATLWSGQALAAKRSYPVNDFVLKTAKVLLTRAGYVVSSSSVSFNNSQEISTLTII